MRRTASISSQVRPATRWSWRSAMRSAWSVSNGRGREKRLEGRRIEPEVRRELPQHRAELARRPQHAGREEVRHRRVDLAQLLHVRDEARPLDR